MSRKLDYMRVWETTIAQLKMHREGLGAIAAVFLFLPDWIARFFAGQLDLQSGSSPVDMIAAMQNFLALHWHVLIPTSLLGLFGAVAIYGLLTRKDMPTIGSVLGKALILLPFYFLVHIIGGLATLAGLLALLLPGMYIAGRLTPLGAVTIAETERGFAGVFQRSWQLSQGNGWSIFFLTLVVGLLASLTGAIISMLIGLGSRLIMGPAGAPFIETGVDAAVNAVITTLLISLSVAIYRYFSEGE